MNLKSFLWRVVYAVILVIVLTFVVPLLLQVVGIAQPAGPAIQLLLVCFAILVLLYCFFGPEPPAPF